MRGMWLLLVTSAVSPAAAQAPRRARAAAFDPAVSIAASLGFNGVRAYQTDSLGCPNRPQRCASHKVGAGPMLSADIQLPIARNFALAAGAAIGRNSRVLCADICQSLESITTVKGSALVLLRLKPRVPVYFGLGAGASRFSPGPVLGLQDGITAVEVGPVGVIGFDFGLGKKVGGRVAWWHYFTKPSAENLPVLYTTPRTHDSLLSFGARIKLKS